MSTRYVQSLDSKLARAVRQSSPRSRAGADAKDGSAERRADPTNSTRRSRWVSRRACPKRGPAQRQSLRGTGAAMMLPDAVILHAGSRRAAREPSALRPRALQEGAVACLRRHECDPSGGGRLRWPRASSSAWSMLIEPSLLGGHVGSGTLTPSRPPSRRSSLRRRLLD